MKTIFLILFPLNLFSQVATLTLADGTFINNAPNGKDWSNYAITGFSLGYTEFQVITDINNPVIINGVTILTSGYQNQPPDNVYPPGNIFDNNLTTKWAAKGFGHWVQFSLPEIRLIESIEVAFTVGDRNDIFDLFISVDSINWTNVLDKQIGDLGTGFNNYDFVDVEVKHIKYIAQGNVQGNYNWNSISEIKFNYVDPIPNEDCICDSIRWIEKDTTIFNYKDSTTYHHVYDTTGSRIDTVFIIPRELILKFK